jgi:hypothetical protein
MLAGWDAERLCRDLASVLFPEGIEDRHSGNLGPNQAEAMDDEDGCVRRRLDLRDRGCRPATPRSYALFFGWWSSMQSHI